MNKSKTQWQPSNLPDHLSLWDVDSWSRSLNFGIVSLVERKGSTSGDSSGTWKRQEFDLPPVLFRGSFGITWSFASILYRWKCHHILSTPNCTSQWRSGNLQDTLAKASGLTTSLLSFAESYVFLLLIGCLSVALCFVFLFRKSPKEILSSS